VILPTKGIAPNKALLAIAGEILRSLDEVKTVSRLWDDFRKHSDPSAEIPFDWFILGLDLLFIFGCVEFDRGRLRSTAGEGQAS
jgi:hypothetical protein